MLHFVNPAFFKPTVASRLHRLAVVHMGTTAHYTSKQLDLGSRLLSEIKQLSPNANLDALTIEDLSEIDEFHTAGRKGSMLVFPLLKLQPRMHVLDCGSGLGGPARFAAKEYKCHITGVDITQEFVDVATMLTSRIKDIAPSSASFTCASVTSMPIIESQSMDAAYTIHVGMNIHDKLQFFREVYRTLKPGSRFVVFDIARGPNADNVIATFRSATIILQLHKLTILLQTNAGVFGG
jgi:SAM-dependent methyltransferase